MLRRHVAPRRFTPAFSVHRLPFAGRSGMFPPILRPPPDRYTEPEQQLGTVGWAAGVFLTTRTGWVGDALDRHCLWRICAALWNLRESFGAERQRRQRTDAGNRGCRAGRRCRVSKSAIHDDCHRGRGGRHSDLVVLGAAFRGCLRDRLGIVRRRRLYRHAYFGARQRAHGRGRAPRAGQRSRTRIQVRRRDGHAGGGFGAPGGRGCTT